jgi:hypothetical protein
MKKTIFAVMALTFAFAAIFVACTKELTDEEMLTQTKGWILTAATSEPPYIMLSEDGEEPEHLRDLMKGYFYDYELDDVYYYDENYALRVDPGKKLPPSGKDGYTAVTTLGSWVLNGKSLTTKVPSFYDKDPVTGTWIMDKVKITNLTKDELTYTFTWDAAAKKKIAKGEEIYTFTLTFSKK